MCIFESETVKSDCPMQDLNIKYRLLVYFTSLTVCSGDIKQKKMKKKSSEKEKKKKRNSSENAQSNGHFQSFFFVPLTLNMKKKNRKSTNKKNLA